MGHSKCNLAFCKDSICRQILQTQVNQAVPDASVAHRCGRCPWPGAKRRLKKSTKSSLRSRQLGCAMESQECNSPLSKVTSLRI